MDKLKNIEVKLQQIRSMLDDVARELADSEISCSTTDIEKIGESIASLSEVQISIYKERPDLKPEYLKETNVNRSHNQEFGRILIQNQHYLSSNKPNRALELLNEFKSGNPPKEYIEMADNEINRIKHIFNV